MGKLIDNNSFWFIKKNPITRVGVFPYLGKQISADCEPDKIYYVLRPKEELFKKETLDSFKLIPLVNDHTMLGSDFTPAEEKGVEGILGEQVSHDKDTIYTDIKIFSENMKDLISNGKKELSLGYFCSYDKQEGTYQGQRYDYIQRNIVGNHLALVDKGRMGSEVRVYDKALCFDSLEGIKEMEYKKKTGEDTEMEELMEMLKKADEETLKKVKTLLSNKSTDEADKEDDKKKEEGKDEENAPKKEDDKKKEGADKCGKDEEEKKDDKKVEDEEEKKDEKKEEGKDEEEKKEKGMDEGAIISMIARKEKLAKEVEGVLGTFDHSAMTEKQVAKYACDKLELGAEEGQEISTIRGYLKGVAKKVVVSMKAEDSSTNVVDTSFDNYLKNAKK